MASQVEIFNSALIHLGEQVIVSTAEDNKRARTLAAQYDITRRALLRSYVWNFAKERVNLAPMQEAPAFGYTYQFQLGPDVLRFVGVYDESEPLYQVNYSGARIPFKIEGRRVLCDVNPLRGFVIKDVTDTTEFDAMFTNSLTWALAAETAIALTNDKGKHEQATAGLMSTIKSARTSNAMEGTPEYYESSEWFDARNSYGSRGPYRMGPVAGY